MILRQITNGRVMGVMRVTRSLGDIEYKTMKDYYWNAHFNVGHKIGGEK